jgi:exonuclease SbcC
VYSCIKDQFYKRREYYNIWTRRSEDISKQIRIQKKKRLALSHTHEKACPLCKSELTQDKTEYVCNQYDNEVAFLNYRYEKLSRIIPELKNKLITQKDTLSRLQEQSEQEKVYLSHIQDIKYQQKHTQQEMNSLTKEIEKIQTQIDTQMAEQNKAHEHVLYIEKQSSNWIKNDTHIQQWNEEEQKIELSLKTCNYDQKSHQKAKDVLKDLSHKKQSLDNIRKEHIMQSERKEQIKSYRIRIKALKKELEKYQSLESTYKDIDTEKKLLQEKEHSLEKHLHTIKSDKEDILERKARLQEKQIFLAEKEKEYLSYKKKYDAYTLHMKDYHILNTAFSKDGIQALLIEQALPEIEQEANNILKRLTENQFHIVIESLKDLKSGKTKETLDIKVADSAGVRPYEMFSGGEAFKIDFALRIAISKLLARRSGTQLQTLIIDEGFGSQDEQGLSNIMESIYKIQGDFKKVIIVSHLPYFKDQFPVHFNITKDSSGSNVHIVEQG